MYTLWFSFVLDFEGEKRGEGEGEGMWDWGGRDEEEWRIVFLGGWGVICVKEVGFLVGGWVGDV